MGVFGLAPMTSILTGTHSGLFARFGRHLESFSLPQPLHPLAVDELMLRFEFGGDATVAVARVQPGEFMETLD